MAYLKITAASLIIAFLFISEAVSQEVKQVNSVDELKTVLEAGKGKVMLVNYWATWCIPCVKEFPELVKLYSAYKEKNFELVFISLDDISDKDTKLKQFLSKQGVDFTTYFGNFPKPEILMDYMDKNWQGEIPATFIFDKEGKPVKTILGAQSYEQFEAEILKLM
ncbi:MAG: TlpA family protein disulfide reductase [Ignavibacteria bacterium]|nr:TlpA family protein disulfide reductase [Ignavibacteria bacterium]